MEHLTPAQQHWQKVMASRRGGASTEMSRADMTAYENILHRLRADQAQLSNIQGNDRKAAYKRKVLPNYRGWIEGGVGKSKWCGWWGLYAHFGVAYRRGFIHRSLTHGRICYPI
nr:phage terminase small subunit [Providencia stuartii]